ncbi:MAG: HAMP domain-containing protein [Nitrospirae bacterium]|nr:MAG: HAMP domain-containing protein [Nitrospirota bacterium]
MKVLKPITVITVLLLFTATLIGLEFHFIKMPNVDVTTKLLLIFLMTVNLIAFLTLMFFVGKSLFLLYMERRQKVLGYKFRTKLMAIFVVLTLIPSAFLFFAASGLAANYINKIFSPQMKEPFNKSVEFARAFYDRERDRALKTARAALSGKDVWAPDLSVKRYASPPPNASEILTDAFAGKEGAEVVSQASGDIVRAAVPETQKNRGGVLVVEIRLPQTIAEKTENLKTLYEDHIKLESFKEPLRLNYILILGFLTLMLVFSGLWVSLKISRGITIPIQRLAMATEEVASGNLDVSVDIKTQDEIGILINSFNQMVRQIKDGKSSLENAYIESDRRRLYLENILENINSGVLFLDTDGKILTMNRAAHSILDFAVEDIIGRDYTEFIQRLNSDELNTMVKDIEGTRINEVSKEVKINIDGRVLICRIYIAGIRDSRDSRSLGMLVVFNDLTDVIKAQKAIAWQEVAQRMAHEIKNPLTPIKLSTERLIKKWHQKDEDFGAVIEKSTRTIINEVEGLKKLVDEFAKYGRLPEIKKGPLHFPELLESVTSLYKGFKDIEIKTDLQEAMPQINLDRDQFKRVLINIIDNAIKAMDGRGLITVSAAVDRNTLKIEISDTGPGISIAEKEKLFMPYFSNRKGGTGLGLAIAHKIVADHGGHIIVRDNHPAGAVFCVEMPKT